MKLYILLGSGHNRMQKTWIFSKNNVWPVASASTDAYLEQLATLLGTVERVEYPLASASLVRVNAL